MSPLKKTDPPLMLYSIFLCVFFLACDETSTRSSSDDLDFEVDMEARSDLSFEPDQDLRGDAAELDMRQSDLDIMPQMADMEIDSCGDSSASPCDMMVVTPTLEINILSPLDGTEESRGAELSLRAQLEASEVNPDFIAISARVDGEILIPISFDPTNGVIEGTVLLNELSVGEHTLEVIARVHPNIEVIQSVNFVIRCDLLIDFDEPLDPNIWTLLGDASQNTGGWLDTTDGTPSSRGAIMLSGIPMQVDSLDASFQVQATPAWDWMGRVPESEAMSDGFAVTFWNITADQIPSLEEIISQSGNGMGYGVYPIQLDATGYQRPESFTIEFDTYYNFCRGTNSGGWYQDPTDQAHVAITYDGYWHFPHHYDNEDGERVEIVAGRTGIDENGQAYSIGCDLILNQGFDIVNNPEHPWVPIPQLRDSEWHDVRVTVLNDAVQIYFDEMLVLTSTAIFNRYKGGILSFSGGSGAAPAYYKFDHLRVVGSCR